jgi:uncharacterized phage-associated protein
MFRNQLNDKIGNLLNYLSTRILGLSMTKALKLLYLIDETSYARTGSPLTWLDYKVWEMGPVAEELYNELKFNQSFLQNGKPLNLDKFICTEKEMIREDKFQIKILPNGNYSLNEFSAFDLDLIDKIIDSFGGYSAAQLIKILHEENTLWHKYVSENNLELNFKVYSKKSNFNIDFSKLIKDDPILQMAAQSAFESMQMEEELNNL